jgi:small-conductance mechanosensitive channel
MSIQTVTAEILQGNFTNDQLSSIIDSVKYARSKLTRHTIRSLQVGDNVNFNSTKIGRNVTGVVVKIAIKFVTVKTVSGLWRVPANMLTVIEDEQEFA